MLANKALSSAPSAEPVFVESVFSTYLYTGNDSTQTITNGIDLSSKGGLVWTKRRNGVASNRLQDTVRGIGKAIYTDFNGGQANEGTGGMSAFLSSGYSLGSFPEYNGSGQTYASWTFREQAKFFDVVTYTGNGANRTIAHNLGSVPGCIIVKRTDTTGDWQVYHRSLANTEYMVLNSTAAKATGTTRWNSTTPTSTEFSLGTDTTVNANGGTYVAYLFAHDAGGFGLTGTDNVISCGTFTSDSAGSVSVNIGYEPQWVLYKTTAVADGWQMVDVMRGMPVDTNGSVSGRRLEANTSAAEASGNFYPTSTGFASTTGLGSSQPYIYIAIRRGPMKVPTSGTSVFTSVARSGTGTTATVSVGFPCDSVISQRRTGGTPYSPVLVNKLAGSTKKMYTNETTAEEAATAPTYLNTSVELSNDVSFNASSTTYINHFFRRAPGFFDVVCRTGALPTVPINHNLGVVPELIIEKTRATTGDWYVWTATQYGRLNVTNAFSSSTQTMTSTTYTPLVNGGGETYVAYLFATCPGVSKVGSYTGTGTTKQIDCGFTGGARFVLIKRTDSTGDWYVWDSARGIVAGNDPYLLLNSTAAEVTNTDYIDTYSAGFEISSTAPAAINANGGTYIFLAVA